MFHHCRLTHSVNLIKHTHVTCGSTGIIMLVHEVLETVAPNKIIPAMTAKVKCYAEEYLCSACVDSSVNVLVSVVVWWSKQGSNCSERWRIEGIVCWDPMSVTGLYGLYEWYYNPTQRKGKAASEKKKRGWTVEAVSGCCCKNWTRLHRDWMKRWQL